MIEDNEWPSKLVFHICFFAFSVFALFGSPNCQRILFMSINANCISQKGARQFTHNYNLISTKETK